MHGRVGERLLVGAGLAYLVVLAWFMANTTYDIWGVLVVAPPLALIGYAGVRRMFRDDLVRLANVMYAGLGVKMIGALLRYWVAFDAYGGRTDAERYHQFGAKAASAVWAGEASWTSVVPRGTGTEFMERFTASVLLLTGTSKLAAFVTFSWMSFWGVAFFVKSASVAVPGLARRRYAALCVIAPSVLYWPSSIGKEAVMMLALGVGTYGLAGLLVRRGLVRPAVVAALGLGGVALVRPHMAAIWLAGIFPGLIVALVRGRTGRGRRTGRTADRVALVAVIAVAAIGLSVVASATVAYLDPTEDEAGSTSDSITDILAETTRRTSEAGSNFTPVTVDGPLDWPVASLRTLTRPLIVEARGLGQLLTALEISAFVVLCGLSYRRLLNVPRLLVSNPYVAFAMTTLFLGGLAYSSFANLGVLTRQKSLLFPFLLLIPCLPLRWWARPSTRDADQNSSMSPSVSAQFASGGIPASLTARHVSTGPPPGSRANPADIWG
jgi:hypothetical protein